MDVILNVIEESGEHGSRHRAVFGYVSKVIDAARDSAARWVDAAITAAHWLVWHRIVEIEQSGEERAAHGAEPLDRMAEDLTRRFGRGFSPQNIQNMPMSYLSFPPDKIRQTASGNFEPVSVKAHFDDLFAAFPLPWSA